ncbi:hypothetical protein K470DRAFT_267013 [Piedraia hortae CBS 480.64]|uniref:V-type proton ATPase subunit S1/VOA1 transmembrane domain-containing protein n=1 Tax=Piedraia hortae CBS 480.64 TaxID=1314780 RepID=A0A6A7BPA8_9PEZI|nr:hypothetical protein K470DRAFT_267013 [Piedraia hortae CBS 480.64]
MVRILLGLTAFTALATADQFFLYSTSPLSTRQAPGPNIADASEVETFISHEVGQCAHENYLFFTGNVSRLGGWTPKGDNRVEVDNVLGDVYMDTLRRDAARCGQVVDIDLNTWKGALKHMLDDLKGSYLLIYASQQGRTEPLREEVHTHLKRKAKETKKSLFEKYQFLTPVSLLLMMLMYVGISALANLKVSYEAFNKEMGPQAQNKGKQQ